MTIIGEMSEKLGEFAVEWKIKEFSSLSSEVNKSYESPSFSFAGATWCLKIYPNGQMNGSLEDGGVMNSEGVIDIFLCRVSPGPPISMDYFIALKMVDGDIISERHFTYIFKARQWWGGYGFLDRSELSKDRVFKFLLTPGDVLSVLCRINYTKSAEVPTPEKLSHDFKTVLLSGDHSDITVKVKEEEFRLHRSILAARNPYFDSMFKSNMKEKFSGIVIIKDCEPDIFRSFIQFVYTGKVDELSAENVCDLYKAADKYQEDELKEECLYFMLNTMSVDNFCDYFVLASRHREKELFREGTEFFTDKKKEITSSAKWQAFMKVNPAAANEMLKVYS